MSDVELHRWFADDELDTCPSCGQHAVIRLPGSDSLFCFACGYVAAAARQRDEAEG